MPANVVTTEDDSTGAFHWEYSNKYHLLPKKTTQVLPLFHSLPFDSISDVTAYRNIPFHTDKNSPPPKQTHQCFFLPGERTKGTILKKSYHTTSKWMSERSEEKNSGGRFTYTHSVKKVENEINECAPEVPVCSVSLATGSVNTLQDCSSIQHLMKGSFNFENSFLCGGRYFVAFNTESYESRLITSMRISILDIGSNQSDDDAAAATPKVWHRYCAVLPFMISMSEEWKSVMFCSKTRRIWYMIGVGDNNIRLFYTCDLFADLHSEQFQMREVKNQPFQHMNRHNPLRDATWNRHGAAVMEDGIIYLYSGMRKIFCLDTTNPCPNVAHEGSSSQDESNEDEEKIQALWDNSHFYTWKCIKILHGHRDLLHERLWRPDISIHNGKLLVFSRERFRKRNNNSVHYSDNKLLFLFDIHKRSLQRLPCSLPQDAWVQTLVLVNDSIFTETYSQKRDFVSFAEWKLRSDTSMQRSKSCAVFSDVNIVCQTTGGVDPPAGRRNKPLPDNRKHSARPHFVVKKDAVSYISEYAKKHGHKPPQIVGDVYHQLGENKNPMDEYFTPDYLRKISEQEAEATLREKRKLSKMKKSKSKKTPSNSSSRKSRSRKKKSLSMSEYLEEVKDSELELVSPVYGEHMKEIFDVIDDPEWTYVGDL